jgi:hypothetical protein
MAYGSTRPALLQPLSLATDVHLLGWAGLGLAAVTSAGYLCGGNRQLPVGGNPVPQVHPAMVLAVTASALTSQVRSDGPFAASIASMKINRRSKVGCRASKSLPRQFFDALNSKVGAVAFPR